MDDAEKREWERDSFHATIRFAEISVQSLLVLTGGAALGVLTFASSHAKNGDDAILAYANAVWWFGWAGALAVLVAGLSYLAQWSFTRHFAWVDWRGHLGNAFQLLAISAWLLSMVFFLFGVTRASDAVKLKAAPGVSKQETPKP